MSFEECYTCGGGFNECVKCHIPFCGCYEDRRFCSGCSDFSYDNLCTECLTSKGPHFCQTCIDKEKKSTAMSNEPSYVDNYSVKISEKAKWDRRQKKAAHVKLYGKKLTKY